MQHGGHAGETEVADEDGGVEALMASFLFYGGTAFLVEKGEGLEYWTRVRGGGTGGRRGGGHTDSKKGLVDGLVLEVEARKILPTYRADGAVVNRTLQAPGTKSLKGTRVRIEQGNRIEERTNMLTRGGHRLVEEDVADVASKLIEKLLVKVGEGVLVLGGGSVERAIGSRFSGACSG